MPDFNWFEEDLIVNLTNETYPNIICLRTLTGSVFILRLNINLININNIIDTLYKRGYKYEGYKNKLNIIKDNFLLDKSKKLNEYLDHKQKLFHLDLSINQAPNQNVEAFKHKANGETLNYKSITGIDRKILYHKDLTISQIKNIIEYNENIPSDEIRLIFAGKQLEDQYTLGYYNILKDSTIHIIQRLKGGMMVESSGKSDLEDLTSNVIDIDPI